MQHHTKLTTHTAHTLLIIIATTATLTLHNTVVMTMLMMMTHAAQMMSVPLHSCHIRKCEHNMHAHTLMVTVSAHVL